MIKKLYASLFLTLIFIIFIVPYVKAEQYYADIDINVDSSGFITIEGTTNHPDLLVENTEKYILKKQSYWLLNITKNHVFSNFVYQLTLPKDSSINYIKSTGSIRIEENIGNLIVNGFGENETLSILLQYQIGKPSDISSYLGNDIFISILIFALIILVIAFFYINKNNDLFKNNKWDKPKISLKGLNQRQKKIIQLLIDSNRTLTQKEIQDELKLPKSAVSRNIHALELKGLIEIEKIGVSNLIRIKKQKE